MAGSILKIGKVRPTFKGEWDSSMPYEVLDWVQYRGLAYQAIQDVPLNREPDVTPEYWAQTGMQGDKGDAGPIGPAGPAGLDGRNGLDGIQGPLGLQGVQGIPGIKGEIGAQGAQGIQGPRGVGPKHTWEGVTLAFENPDGTWASPVDLRGPQGVRGQEGPVGTQGIPGPVGAQGAQGPQGLVGPKGATPGLNNTVTSTSTTEAATANAAKVAYDRGTAGINAANAAQGAANAARQVADSKAPGGFGLGTGSTLITDCNHAVENGWYDGSNMLNAPTGGWFTIFVARHSHTNTWCYQQAFGYAGAAGIWWRQCNSGVWTGWQQMDAVTIPVGHISMLPFRHNALPFGWYFCNGTRHANGGAQATVLNALSASFKADWGITNNGSTTNVPNWFYGGRGPVMRAVDGSSRQVGSVEDGAIQNITGGLLNVAHGRALRGSATGAFSRAAGTDQGNAGDAGSTNLFTFNAANVVSTAAETRTLNRGMTPAIFLGV